MKLSSLFAQGRRTLSFEVFPSKTAATFESVMQATQDIARLNPSYMSVTYGAGGGTSEYTIAIAKNLLNHGVTPLAHLTCVSSTKETVFERINDFKQAGIENILALRGDIPADADKNQPRYYKYACELIRDIKANGDFCVGGACYPDGHPECESYSQDILNLKTKVEAGCEFLTTQMFFDNNLFYTFLYRVRDAGITVPILPGIMPITNATQMRRTVMLSGTPLPPAFKHILDRFGSNPAAMKQAGIAYATNQIVDLYANGINAVHVYSMNKPDVACAIQANLSDII